MKRPCAYAESKVQPPWKRAMSYVSAAGILVLMVFLLIKKVISATYAALLMLSVLLLVYQIISEGERHRRLVFTISPEKIKYNDDCRMMAALKGVDLDWIRQSWYHGWTPALVLRLGSQTWRLPLSYEGWYEFWDCLRKLRPDLGLPDWRRLRVMRRWLAGARRYGLVLPPEVKVRQAGGILRWSLAVGGSITVDYLARTLAGQRLTPLVMALLAMGLSFLSEYLLTAVYPPRIVAAPWLDDSGSNELELSR